MKFKIVHISDTHGKHKHLQIPECDILIHSGDISPVGEKHQIEAFCKWFTKQTQATYRIFIPGNHDKLFDPIVRPAAYNFRDILDEFGISYNWDRGSNTICLIDYGISILGVKIWGSPVTPEFGYGWAFNAKRGEQIARVWKGIIDADIVVTHGPPQFYNDFTQQGGLYVGCEELREVIKRVKPLLSLHGHIHEGYGYSYDADTHYFNGSICTLRGYEPINAPWVIEADFEEHTIKILNDTSKGKEDKTDQDEELRGPGDTTGTTISTERRE